MDLLSVGQKVNLYFQKDSNIVEMACTIEKVMDDRLEVALPQYFMRYIEYLQAGCEISVKVFSRLGTIDFNSIIISSPLEETFSIELDYNAMKLTTGDEIPVVNAIETLQIKVDNETLKLSTFAISTNFIKFNSDRPFKLDETFEGTLILPSDYGIIEFKAVISEVDPVFDNEFTATYITMTESDRQNLLYYMYSTNAD